MAIDRSKQFHSTGHLVIINIYVFLCYTPIPAEAEFDGLTAGLGTIQLCL
jgi:hypothetical protein